MPAATATFTGPQYYDDCLGPLWFEAFAADLVRRLPEQPAGDVLEIACGTGIVTRKLRGQLAPSQRLVASDLSPAMLDYARAKLGDRNGIEWMEADALALPFSDASFGAVVCGFGFMFVPDRHAALREARRVLVEGGLLLFNVWDRIEENPHAATNAMVIEALFPGDPEMRFRTPYEMHDPVVLRQLLAGAGLREQRIETRRYPIQGADPRAIATGQIRGTPRAALIQKRGVALDLVIDQASAALAAAGGNPYAGYAQAVVVEARAV